MSFLIFAWTAAILYGLVNVIGKLTSKYAVENVWLFNFLYGLCSLLFTLPIVFANHVGIPNAWGNLSLAVLFNILFSFCYTIAIFSMDLSVMGPLFNFRTVFALLLGVLMLHETLSVTQSVLIGLIFLAGIFVSMDERLSIKSFFKKSTLNVLLMSLFLALSSIYINKSVAEIGYWETTLFVPLLSQLAFLTTIPFFWKELPKINEKQIGGVAAMALCLALGNFASIKAYASNVSISTAIEALPISMFIVFFLSRVKPDLLEKHSGKIYAIRFTAAFVMIIAALRLSGWGV